MKCSRCSNKFEPVLGKLYCSEDCRYRAKKARRRVKVNKQFKCEQCGRDFWRNSDRGRTYRFCSMQCVGASNRKPDKPAPTLLDKTCAGCGNQFTTARLNQTYCVPGCSIIRTCPGCWGSFEVNQSTLSQLYCTKKCDPSYHLNQRVSILYMLKCGPYVKLGFTTTSMARRLSQIRNACPYQIDVITTKPGTYAQEQELQAGASAWRYQLEQGGGREWYTDCPEFRIYCDRFFFPVEGDPSGTQAQGRTDDPPTRPPCEEEVLFGRACHCTCLHTAHPILNHGPRCPEQFT